MMLLQRRFVRYGECWFGALPDKNSADIVSHIQSPKPLPGLQCTTFNTILIDLSKDSDELLAAMKRDMRYELRRVQKDDLRYEWIAEFSPQLIDEFEEFYNAFMRSLGRPLLDRARLQMYIDAGRLVLTRAQSPDGGTLVWLGWYVQEPRVRALYLATTPRGSASSEVRNLVGRATRYVYWEGMQRLKTKGITVLDLGGWYPGAEDAKRLTINKFKEEFGGAAAVEYDGTEALTMKGRLYLLVKRLMGKT